MKITMAYLWWNVNLWLTNSVKQQRTNNTFFLLNLFVTSNIIRKTGVYEADVASETSREFIF